MLQPAVNIMVKAARAGGNVLLRHMHRLDALNVVEKDRLDYASGHGIGSTADANKDWATDIAAFVLEVTRTGTGDGTAGAAP